MTVITQAIVDYIEKILEQIYPGGRLVALYELSDWLREKIAELEEER